MTVSQLVQSIEVNVGSVYGTLCVCVCVLGLDNSHGLTMLNNTTYGSGLGPTAFISSVQNPKSKPYFLFNGQFGPF